MENCDYENLPRYECHKKVWALKIEALSIQNDGSGLLTPADCRYLPINLPRDYMEKHKPTIGGYYVVYDDGYKSFSPAQAFESGYTLIND